MNTSSFSLILRQAWRMSWRDWRAGELRFLLAALMLAVAALSSVSFLADRMNSRLTRDASELLGADLVIRSDNPLPGSWRDQAESLGLSSAQTITFPSMASTGKGATQDTRLTAVKAVSASYPLRGALKIEQAGTVSDVRSRPAAGTVWIDASYMAARQLKTGDALQLGERQFLVGAAILLEQDRGAGFMNFSPRVMLAMDDLASTGLVQPGSRVNYRLLLAGESGAVKRYQAWVQQQLERSPQRGLEVESLESGQPEMRATLDRARQFLALVSLLSAMLAALAIALAARHFLQRHLDTCAMLRCLGLTQNQVTAMYLTEFSLIGLVGSVLGAALGFAAHFLLLQWLGPLLTGVLPPPGLLPLVQAIATGLLLLLGFAIPPVVQLRNVSHNRVMRREQDPPKAFTLAGYALALGSFIVLLIWQSGDIKLGLVTSAGFIGGLIVFAGFGWALLKSLHLLRAPLNFPAWRFALSSLKRRPGASVLQMVALAIGLMALLILTVVRQDLLSAWRQSSPPDAPNHFMINIQPDQKEAIARTLQAEGIRNVQLHPMIRGRLLEISERPVTAASFTDERARRLVEREFNLSTMQAIPEQNLIVAGRWFTAGSEAFEASVEQGLAKTLGLKLGDTLRFDVGGQSVEARITSLRKLDWGSMRVNFFVILNPPAAEALPRSWITAFRVPPTQQGLVSQLIATYPNLTIVDVGSVLAQVQRVIDQVVAAVEFLFLFTLAAGVLVLMAAMLGSQYERMREAGLLRALGATRDLLSRAQRLEYLLVGSAAGLMAATGASLVGWILARTVFDFEWTFSPALWAVGMLAGAACALAGGWAGLRVVLNQPPLQTLREA